MIGDTFDFRDRLSQYGGSPPVNTYGQQPVDPTTQQQQQGAPGPNLIDQLKQLLGSDFSAQHLTQLLSQIQGLGIKVQNQGIAGHDLRPRFWLPDTKHTWDFGPEGWIDRGDIGDFTAPDGGGGGGAGGTATVQGGGLGDTPGFQFQLQQGLLGIDRGDAARGTLLSGGNIKRRALFAAQLGDQTFQQQVQDALNRAKLGMPPPPA